MKKSVPDWLYRHLLFAELEEPQLTQVIAAALPVWLEAGEELFSHGQRASRFYILETGTIQLYRLSAAGEEKVIELIQPRQSFAEAVMFMEGNLYPVSARAIVPSELWGFDMKVFRTVLQTSPAVCFRLLGRMSQRLHQLLQEIDELTLQNATMRVAQYLLRSAPDQNCTCYSVQWETPKQVLASRLSVRPETFSRILQQLVQAGMIQVHGKTVEVLDAARLRNWAGQSD
ncbi:Crp/Fnr family transcriptional regulator [Methylocaldum sp. RMAD-M]|uniref:Crp/Fnr family transcriptional regulator n=1 Tax=Methylocaldum sp. RMAD-M TaxID=2806557 RepID=UPI000A323CB0|nr:Crp/Fnr family transcriptional regulator [Methylocaldum sp. RMAD-M]MBP1152692.1 CRP-like cAMP-binding protein [Methylocaldum sp. RMAD-M]